MHFRSPLVAALYALALTAEAKHKTCPTKSSSAGLSSATSTASSSVVAVGGGAAPSSIAVGGGASPSSISIHPGTITQAQSTTSLAGTTTAAAHSSSSSASSSTPAASSSVAAIKTPGSLKFAQPALKGALSGLRYTGVGGSGGTYDQVTHMNPGTWPSCNVQACTTTPVSVSGPLAPFDDQMTFVFRSMNVHNIAVFQPKDGSAGAAEWDLTSSFAAGSPMHNMVWMNNMGAADLSGEWDICNGASQSFADPTFTKAAKSPTAGIFNGVIPPGFEANIMASTPCSAGTCPGFVRGAGQEGWGGSKLMIVEFAMPATAADKPPAIWALNAQVVRSAQYGCNCRGMGGKGGCGELDIFEVLPSAPANQAFSELYSFKGATGSGSNAYFTRPTSGTVTYATLFDLKTDTITIIRLDSFDWSTQAMARSTIDDFVSAQAMNVPFGSSKKRHVRHGYQLHDLRRRHGSF